MSSFSPMSSFFLTLSKPVFEKFDLILVSYQCSLFMPKLNLDILFIKIPWFIGCLKHLKFILSEFLLLLLFRFQSHSSKLRKYGGGGEAKSIKKLEKGDI